MLDRTLNHILEGEEAFKTLGASRTDAMVSAHHHLSQLFFKEEKCKDTLLKKLNENLPFDIRALKLEDSPEKFNIINSSKEKEYHYYFCYGDKPHPFSAAFMTHFKDQLNIEKMKNAAKIFQGTHNFQQYCYRPDQKTDFIRTIKHCSLERNDQLTGSFIPKNSYYMKVIGEGFLHHQVRIMMGALVSVGADELSIEMIQESFSHTADYPISFIAPASGLHLIKISL